MNGDPVLVLLPAFPFDARLWGQVRDELADFDVRTLDHPGFGDTPPDDREEFAATTEALGEFDPTRLVLVGCSMGGYAIMHALRSITPAGVVLCNTKASADSEGARAGRLDLAEHAEREPVSEWLAEKLVPSLVGTTTRTSKPELAERAEEWIRAQDSAAVAWAARTMAARPDSTELLRESSIPARVITGEEDVLTGPDLANELAGLLDLDAPVVLEEAGHLTPLEAPGPLAEQIRDFVQTL